MNFPFHLARPNLQLARTLTLDEAIAYARYYAGDDVAAWGDMKIYHDDGRTWHWEIKRGKPHLVEGVRQ